MCTDKKIHGLSLFLWGLLELIKDGKQESCEFVESKFSSGISTELYNKYKAHFDACGFDPDNRQEIDCFYKNYAGCTDGVECRKFLCDSKDGLYLLIKLAALHLG